MVMKGYYNLPDETAEVFTHDGYFKTGDIGYLHPENYLYLTGRARNLIVTEGGKNVYPEEIENCFQLFDEIDQILIRGYVDNPANKVEQIEALVFPNMERFTQIDPGSAAGREQIATRSNEIVADVNHNSLTPYQRIDRVQILDEPMEMTTSKKIKRHSVEEPQTH